MKDSTYKLIITLLSLVIVIGGSLLLYQNLSDQIDPNTLTQPPQESVNAFAAPEFTVTDPDGNEVKLSDFLGKPVVVNFWASWCGPCKSEMPHFQAAYEQYGEDVEFLMVNMSAAFGDTREEAETVLANGGFTFPVYYDTNAECAINYGISGIPVTLFIDAQGNLADAWQGMLSASMLEQGILSITD